MSRKLDRKEKFVAFCSYCGTFLQETHGDCNCNVVCTGCGRDMAVVVRNGKVTVFEERNNEEVPDYKEKVRLICYAVKMNQIGRDKSKLIAEPTVSYGTGQ